jgi:iron(III) transport system permease protein
MKALISAQEEIFTSFILCIISALIIVFLSIIPAYYFKKKIHYMMIMLLIISLPLVLPSPLIGLGIIKLFNQKFLFLDLIYHSPFVIIYSWVLLFLPYGIFILWIGFREISEDLENAAKIDGASKIKIIKNLYFISLKEYFISAFFIGMVLSFGEVGASILITPPGWTPLSVRIFSFLHYGMNSYISALCLVQILFVILGVLIVSSLLLKKDY